MKRVAPGRFAGTISVFVALYTVTPFTHLEGCIAKPSGTAQLQTFVESRCNSTEFVHSVPESTADTVVNEYFPVVAVPDKEIRDVGFVRSFVFSIGLLAFALEEVFDFSVVVFYRGVFCWMFRRVFFGRVFFQVSFRCPMLYVLTGSFVACLSVCRFVRVLRLVRVILGDSVLLRVCSHLQGLLTARVVLLDDVGELRLEDGILSSRNHATLLERITVQRVTRFTHHKRHVARFVSTTQTHALSHAPQLSVVVKLPGVGTVLQRDPFVHLGR